MPGSAMEGTFVAGVADQYITADGTKVLTESELEGYLAGGALTGTDASTTKDGRCNGSVYVVIPVDTSRLGGKTVVAFETLYAYSGKGGTGETKPVADHKDLTDEKQTVSVPKIHTTAAIGGEKSAVASTSTTVTDTVKGELMDKETGEATGATAEAEFTAEDTDGTVELAFTIDTSSLAGHSLVAYETVIDTKTGITVAEHKDLDDADQTVGITQPSAESHTSTSTPVKTGDDTPVGPMAAALAAAAAAIAAVLRRKKKA